MGKEYTRLVTVLGDIPIAGQVIAYDDFEHGLKWSKTSGEGDSIFEIDPVIAKTGNHSLFMKTRTIGAAQNDIIGAERKLHLLPSKILTFVASFYSPSFVATGAITFSFLWYTGAILYTARVLFEPNIPRWKCMIPPSGFPTIPGFSVDLIVNAWHTIILRADFNTLKYISLQVDHMFADLSGYDLNTTDPSTTDSHLLQQIYFDTAGAAPAQLYIDETLLHEL